MRGQRVVDEIDVEREQALERLRLGQKYAQEFALFAEHGLAQRGRKRNAERGLDRMVSQTRQTEPNFAQTVRQRDRARALAQAGIRGVERGI